MAKIAREQAVRERRLRKQEKKLDKKLAAAALGAETESTPPAEDDVGEAADDETPDA